MKIKKIVAWIAICLITIPAILFAGSSICIVIFSVVKALIEGESPALTEFCAFIGFVVAIFGIVSLSAWAWETIKENR